MRLKKKNDQQCDYIRKNKIASNVPTHYYYYERYLPFAHSNSNPLNQYIFLKFYYLLGKNINNYVFVNPFSIFNLSF